MCESEVGSSSGSLPSETETELDRISNLPSEVIQDILSRLPIGEAVKTSVLSRKWMDKYAGIRRITFNNQLVVPSHTTFTEIVHHVLLLHIGPIDTFTLSRSELIASGDIDRWISHLLRNCLKEFRLDVWKGQPYKIPSRLFSCDALVDLELFKCLLKFPPTFNGFKCLKRLDLQKVSLTQDAFEKMVVSSPLLERLTFIGFNGFTNLKIDAPNLQYLDLRGVFQDVAFENTYKLTNVTIGLVADADRTQLLETSNNLVKFCVQLPSIQSLRILDSFLEYLAVGALPEKLLPTQYTCLEFLSLTVCFSNPKEILAGLILLRSSPAVQKLEILAKKEDHPVPVEEANTLFDDSENWSFPQLQLVEITDISGGLKDELYVIRLLLSNSPLLKKMTVKPDSRNCCPGLVKELLRFRRASAYAEIYLDP